MTQYIDKDALIAKIEKRIKYNHERAYLDRSPFMAGREEEGKDILSIIDTSEVKDIDLEKELDSMITPELKFHKALPSLFDVAKHFFELGLKAQHDNWKVVDNINPPQADRNKIYCVLSKNKYLLARVINNPQDEDLLQWKCTEFPFHRYDMCEGDKYMQIV